VPVTLLISDANILIDMEVGGLVERLFRLEYRFAVPDVLFHDELASRHGYLPGLGLLLLELTPKGVQYAVELIQRYRPLRTSRYDLLAAALAKQEACPLLTGDTDLRRVCDEQGIEVHGTIWLMEELHAAGIVDAAEAGVAYQQMREHGSRLPWNEVRAQLKRFRKSST
jgi:predicted nucleic acid-binding protein